MSKASSQGSDPVQNSEPAQHVAPESGSARGRLSRRGLFGAIGAGAALAGAGAVVGRVTAPEHTHAAADIVEFRGEHQSGIVTPTQDRLHFVSFDVVTESRDRLVAMLREWTEVAERMTKGEETYPGAAVDGPQYAPPKDTGEALGLAPSQLTLTIGFGPSLFGTADNDRFDIYARKPAALVDLPHFPGQILNPAISGGDIAIQACSNDPQVAVHAVRNLARIGTGIVAVKWSQLGFGRTSSTSTDQVTARNLMGFKDGTNNLKAEDPSAVSEFVWVDPADDQDWLAGGSFLVTRRIRMLIESWDRTTLNEQERVIGRFKGNGAPFGGSEEFDQVDLQSAGPHGPMIDHRAHIRLASAESLGGVKLLRRGYNFTDGSDGFGHLDAGLFFIAYCRNPQTQFVPMQLQLARSDLLNEYIQHTSSAVFAVPPGLRDGQYWGSTLFGAAGSPPA
ncbi:iron uptake transporter deferrochelatase/peroxidase subunit [Aldersonia sp. NBC_00410]|uniref:iron uptake transporter deferrochelatase/peroxidase subunit n=1 Tax=Aldersonia sp. NBC_00410 TaxID=2975954 RepID=UPI002254CC77|nr:iron uptake transporter deferrochelatase/peroxidase subunit [Aldersonia sp. NBC_00410]MCX5045508.1 iron uptake transporter deferrochelatase/peroxidase subunit [Aldersonia sp. NBC_00410]